MNREDIIKELGLESRSAAEQDEMLANLEESIFEAALDEAMLALADENKNKLTELLNADAEESKLISFLQTALPNFNALIKEKSIQAVTAFKQASLSGKLG